MYFPNALPADIPYGIDLNVNEFDIRTFVFTPHINKLYLIVLRSNIL
jgi:hypothetical protein